MANKKISELEENTSIQNGCCFPIVSDNATKKVTFATIKAKIDSLLGITAHTSNKNNPHSVTPAQIGTYNSGAIDGLLSKKVDKENGKGLSTNDFTDADKNAVTEIYGMATYLIAQGEDLNNFTSPGVFRCGSGTTATTLANCPTKYGFRLEVKSITSINRVIHILYPSVVEDAVFYTRKYTANGWGGWVSFLGDDKIADLEVRIAALEAVLTTTQEV